MITVKLIGGLGNQMFQYAAARRLAQIHKTTLKLDCSWFDSIESCDTNRKYELSCFDIFEDFVAKKGSPKTNNGRFDRFKRVIKRAVPFFKDNNYIIEKHFNFDESILELPDNVYLNGYWQSEKYFKDIEDVLRKEFTVKHSFEGENETTADMIVSNKAAVSIHVRRGDYVSNPSTAQYHGSCSLEYYKKAIDTITSELSNAHFFVFSDDPDWVKQNLKIEFASTYIDFNGGEKAYEDMRLMSLCRHHIIANSSFSWWGAWLNPSNEKIVVAPRRWFKRDDIDTRDLVPDSWVRI